MMQQIFAPNASRYVRHRGRGAATLGKSAISSTSARVDENPREILKQVDRPRDPASCTGVSAEGVTLILFSFCVRSSIKTSHHLGKVPPWDRIGWTRM